MRLRRRHPGEQPPVDEEPPNLPERNVADELLDVDSAIPQRATFPVRLGNLGGEGDYAFEARLDFCGGAHQWLLVSVLWEPRRLPRYRFLPVNELLLGSGPDLGPDHRAQRLRHHPDALG